MKYEFTNEQKMAVSEPAPMLVSAAAGSGKTAVLVERAIQKLISPENPISADRLLIVTFTNAAAAEMRGRIEKRLYEECRNNPQNANLLRQKRLLPAADICTIDSFCIRLIRENFEKCGIEPDFAVGDGAEIRGKCDELLKSVICEYLENNKDAISNLLEKLENNSGFDVTSSTVKDIYENAKNRPFENDYYNALTAPYEAEFKAGHIWFDTSFDKADKIAARLREDAVLLNDAALTIDYNRQKFIDYAATVALLADTVCETVKKRNWDDMFVLLSSAALPDAPRRKPKVTIDEIEAFISIKDRIIGNIGNLKSLFPTDYLSVKAQNAEFLPIIKILVDITRKYSDAVMKYKKSENYFTFADIEQLALGILCERTEKGIVLSPTAHSLTERYDEVMVDEFQDVNDLQNAIFDLLSDNMKKLFVVGDIKQSIYGFRGSNPDNFMRKKDNFMPIESAGKTDPKKVFLSDNFRSRKEICDYANFLFSNIMTGQAGSLVYAKEDYLNSKGEFEDTGFSKVDLVIADKCDDEDTDSTLQFEGRVIADKIKDIIASGQTVSTRNGLKKAEYSDMVILLAAMKNKAPVIAEELIGAGIPVSFDGEDFFDAAEITVFTSLLKIIDNPASDVELLTVMMSPMFSFSAEEMAQIKLKSKGESLISLVAYSAENGNKKADDFLKALRRLRLRCSVLPLDRAVSYLLNETGYIETVSAMSGGNVGRANLLALQDVAKSFTASKKSGIGAFLKYLNTLSGKNIGSCVSAANGVRIISMHKSKGLQYPICFLAALSNKINRDEKRDAVILSERFGMNIRYRNYETSEQVEHISRKLALDEIDISTTAERMRLLYVAVTRAIDRLIMVVNTKDISKRLATLSGNIKGSYPYITDEKLISTGSFADLVLQTALIHPDGKKLRSCCEAHLPVVSHESGINIRIVNTYTKSAAEVKAAPIPDDALKGKICENLSYKYPYDELLGLKAKFSVSDIANKAESERFNFTSKPYFMLKDGLTPAGRGSAMHKIMQFFDFSKANDTDGEIERLTEYRYITEAEAKSADKKALKAFFESDLFARISKSKNIHREMRFLTEVKAGELDNTLSERVSGEPLVIQGAVDLCFEENGSIILVDFKTDRVESKAELVSAYSKQLDIYAAACENIFNKKVSERIIYSFALNSEIVL